MKDVVFTSYAFGPLYCMQHERLRISILKQYPQANIRFWCSESGSSIDEGHPPGARTFHESMYGFKVHCVRNCIEEGFTRIIFLDVAIVLEGGVEQVLKKAAEIGVLCTRENTELSTVTSDRCLAYIGKTREQIAHLSLVGGSVYIFDFNHPKALLTFRRWEELERDGLFGSEYEASHVGLQGHRCDETCLALALDENGIEPQGFDVVGYHNLGNGAASRIFTFYKLHWKGVGKVQDHSVLQALLPLHGNILDLGCRDFVFTDFFRSQEYNVYPVDIGAFLEPHPEYYRLAITAKSGRCGVCNEYDSDATHICEGDEVEALTIEDFSRRVGVRHWDLIKMDIEGAEYDIMLTAKHPIAEQVSVEFHAHLGRSKHDLDGLLDYLSQFYTIYNRDWCEAQGCGFNYWDILLVAKEWKTL